MKAPRKLWIILFLLPVTAWAAMPLSSFSNPDAGKHWSNATLKAATGSAALSALISSKSGTQNARLWIITIANNGTATANNVLISGFTLTQVAGAACTPVVTPPAAFPFSLGNIAPMTSVNAPPMTIDFTGCPVNARFTLLIRFVANSGLIQGSKTLYNQFE